MSNSQTHRAYKYVGSPAIRSAALQSARRFPILKIEDLGDCLASLGHSRHENPSVLTFIIDGAGNLWTADRRSEHVACANGSHVLAAGELTLEKCGGHLQVTGVTNLSTGYCPEPCSWDVVQQVFDRIGILHPGKFTECFEFRRCDQCHSVNLIKDNYFWCDVCNAELSQNGILSISSTGSLDTSPTPLVLEFVTPALVTLYPERGDAENPFVARQTRHAGQTRISVNLSHAKSAKIKTQLEEASAFLQSLLTTAEQLTNPQRWERILERIIEKFITPKTLHSVLPTPAPG